MIRPRRLIVLAFAMITLSLAGCTAPAPIPTSSSTLTLQSPSTPPAPSREGRAAGAFAPLTVPDSLPVGVGGIPADSAYTPAADLLNVGQVAVIKGSQCQMTGGTALLVAVDEISAPLSGSDRATILGEEGFDPSGQQVVQRITFRLRAFAGADIPATAPQWSLNGFMRVYNFGHMGEMPIRYVGSATPLTDYPVSSGTTVQVVAYAIGTPDPEAASRVQDVQFFSGCNTAKQTVTFQSPTMAGSGGAGD
ncbi:MAG: hypothetical protein CMH36_08830 [Microbacterium sp.]|uniref:hypothetical protein n=1 Tax=uncultured Microbacterium sp. TaxID=191216 RepID=UPI000C8E7FC0|nr:hypothetical protein [Microbacterium sp.]